MQKYFNKTKFFNEIERFFIKESNLKHILKTRKISEKQKKIYLENRLIKHGYHKKATILLKNL